MSVKTYFKKKVNRKFKKRMLEITSHMPKMKPYTVRGSAIDMNCWLDFDVVVVPPSYGANKNYIETIKGKYAGFENQSINDLEKAELHYFIFNSAKLGWLNCDRFVDDPAEKIHMSLKIKKPSDVMVKMVYKELKSVVPPRFEKGIYYFENIPLDKDITLLLMRYGNKRVEMSIIEQKTREGEIKNINFKDYSMGELQLELKKLN